MFKVAGALLVSGLAAAPLFAQQQPDSSAVSACQRPDTIMVTGNAQVDEGTIRGAIGLIPQAALNYRDIQRAIKALFSLGKFDDVQIVCTRIPGTKVALNVLVKERPILASTSVKGVSKVSPKEVKARLELPVGAPIDPSAVARAVARADSLYESAGYYLAKIRVDSTMEGGELQIAFNVDEGNRLAISGIDVSGNRNVRSSAIVQAMQTQPEGFWWFRKGAFDESIFAGDLTERIPQLYGQRGYIDFQVQRDTMIVDKARGKGELKLDVKEGPRYTVGTFEALGNRHFSDEEIRRYYPFDKQDQSLAQSVMGIFRRRYRSPVGTFDKARWDDAASKLRDAYSDEGYIYASVAPIEERVPSEDSVRKVNLRYEIREGTPAIVNRIDIYGNDYTYESCIRDQIVMAPGQVFKRDGLIRSYQNIANLNFFEQPMPEPDVKPDSFGDVNVIFRVKEKRTGNVNFGASMGQGTGLGGFIGLDQPNLFGRCKRAQLQWQFGNYINDFSLTYQDPNILRSRISGSVTAYHSLARYLIADLGQSTRTGGQMQLGFPVPRSYYSRFFMSYAGEAVKYADNTGTLLGSLVTTCKSCFRSSLGLTYQHDTRLGLPFPTQGGMQSISTELNGGPLGGTASFQKISTEMRSYAPLAYIGGSGVGSQPLTALLGLSARAGAVVGNPGPFFASQSFALGGTQFGEQLRGYCEFSITPAGYDPTACDGTAKRESFGNAYFVATAELGLRVNQSLYINTFAEGGNVWNKVKQFNPSRLFRSVGFSGSVLSPFGPLGVDLAYGLDRLDLAGRKNPGWRAHFRLGQIF